MSKLIDKLQDQDCYAICTEVTPALSSEEILVKLGMDKSWLCIDRKHLALTSTGLFAVEVAFDNIRDGLVRVCPYGSSSEYPDADIRHVPLDSLVESSKVRKYEGSRLK